MNISFPQTFCTGRIQFRSLKDLLVRAVSCTKQYIQSNESSRTEQKMTLTSSHTYIVWAVNDAVNGFMTLRPFSSIGFQRWLDYQRAIAHLVRKQRLIKGEDTNPLGLFGRLPLEIREMVYQKHLKVGYLIPCKAPHADNTVSFDFYTYPIPRTSFLRSGWTANRDAKRCLYANNVIVLQGQDSQGLNDFIWNLTEDTTNIARRFHIKFSWRDLSDAVLGETKTDAINTMKSQGTFTSSTRQIRQTIIHDAVRDELLGFWWARFNLISHMVLDTLTLDFREATCPDGCCLDLASKLAYDLPKLFHEEPKVLKFITNVKDYRRRLKWVFRKSQRRGPF